MSDKKNTTKEVLKELHTQLDSVEHLLTAMNSSEERPSVLLEQVMTDVTYCIELLEQELKF